VFLPFKKTLHNDERAELKNKIKMRKKGLGITKGMDR
jgi:hypothetical protein